LINNICFSHPFDNNIFESILDETQYVGYYDLPNQDLGYLDNFYRQMRLRIKPEIITDIVIIGIGGSSLGTKAIYEFMKTRKKLARKIHFIDSTDPNTILSICKSINLQSSYFFIISKSGTTIETLASYKYILSSIKDIELKKNNFAIITDPNSSLQKYAENHDILFLNSSPDVGGRFSVLSEVGIVPLWFCGIDIKKLLNGAKSVKDNFFMKKLIYKNILTKGSFYSANQKKYNINALFSYSDAFQSLNDWYVQLWGESLGKKHKTTQKNIGLTPVGLIGPKDQHSFLQLISEGPRDKTVTFLKIKNYENNYKIPKASINNLEEFDDLNGIRFSKLINLQADSVIESLKNYKEIPLDEIIITEQNESSIGQLIFYFQLLTSVVGGYLGVNTYDQPGVESGKKILKKYLEKL